MHKSLKLRNISKIKIDNLKGVGQVKINGELWRAVSENESEIISSDTQVVIIKVDGVKLRSIIVAIYGNSPHGRCGIVV